MLYCCMMAVSLITVGQACGQPGHNATQRTRVSNTSGLRRSALLAPCPRNQFGHAAARLGSDTVVHDIIPSISKIDKTVTVVVIHDHSS